MHTPVSTVKESEIPSYCYCSLSMSPEKLLVDSFNGHCDNTHQRKWVLSRVCIYCFTCCEIDFDPRGCCAVSGSDNAGRCIWCGFEYPDCFPDNLCSVMCNINCICFQYECLNPFLLTGCPCFLFFLSSCCGEIKRTIHQRYF